METTSSSAEALRSIFSSIADRIHGLSVDDMDRLRAGVCVYVRAIKAEGVMPERVVVSVHEIAKSADVLLGDSRALESIIPLAIEEYFNDRTPTTLRLDGPEAPPVS